MSIVVLSDFILCPGVRDKWAGAAYMWESSIGLSKSSLKWTLFESF